MSAKRIIKKFPANNRTKSSPIGDKHASRVSTDVSSETNGPSTSSTLQPYKMGNADYVLPKTFEDAHVGPQYVVKEAFHLEGMNKNDIVNVNESCKNCEREKQEKTIIGKFKKIKSNWTVKSCSILGVFITLIEIILLAYFYFTSAKQNQVHLINPLSIDMMNNNLEGFIPRTRLSVDSNDCAYKCPKLKSKIRFFKVPEYMHYCFFARPFDGILCERYMMSKMEGSPNQYVRDTFYNYIIWGGVRIIYEGRPLTCPHDESFLNDDHSSVITVGILSYGHELSDAVVSLKGTDSIADLVTNLREKHMLTTDFVLDFPDTWKSDLLSERIKRVPGIGRISYYKQDIYKNSNLFTEIGYTSDMKLLYRLFQHPDDTLQNDTRPSLKIQFPFTKNFSLPDSSSSSVKPKIDVTFLRYINIYFHRNLQFCSSSKIFLEECWPLIIEYINTSNTIFLNGSVSNYFCFPNIHDVIYGQIPINYLNIISHKGALSVVNIFIIHNSYNGSFVLNEDTLIWLINVYKSISDDVRTRIDFDKLVTWGNSYEDFH